MARARALGKTWKNARSVARTNIRSRSPSCPPRARGTVHGSDQRQRKVNTAALCNKSELDGGKKGEFSGLRLRAVTSSPKITGFLPEPQEKFLFPWNGPRELQGEDENTERAQHERD
ncbi:uncharacterized protein V6R79_001494 [Siganus canaliculatus]